MTTGQALAVDQIRAVEAAGDGRLELLGISEPSQTGWITLTLSLSCAGFPRNPGGLPLRARERVLALIPPGFPFACPEAWTPHRRFRGFEHVQWGFYMCLYLSKETEWSPADGMFGWLNRLEAWLRAGALNEWEEQGAPLHPPVAYAVKGTPTVIARMDTPAVHDSPWLGMADFRVHGETRLDLVGWRDYPYATNGLAGPAVLLTHPLPWEFPKSGIALLRLLEKAGVSRNEVLLLLKIATLVNGEEQPLYFVVGTPMRGVQGGQRIQHLTVWRVPPQYAKDFYLTVQEAGDSAQLTKLREKLAATLMQLLELSEVQWCTVREARPAVLARRDGGTPVNWFRGKRVALWGCGALGGYVGIMLARAGVSELVLCDNGEVAPGLLERQPYTDADLTHAKTRALAERIHAIAPDATVTVDPRNLVTGALSEDDWHRNVDLIVDATASRLVHQKCEDSRQATEGEVPPVAFLMIDRSAQMGMAGLAPSEFSGATVDLTRKAKIKASRDPSATGFRKSFWPAEAPELFTPEPGCSSPTFVGSSADMMALAGSMLNLVARDLAAGGREGTVHFLPSSTSGDPALGPITYRWAPDRVLLDGVSGYEVRIGASAWRSISGWIGKNSREGQSESETGGVLFGETNEALRVVWVDDVIGPPRDSVASPEEFICGIEGVREANDAKLAQTGDSVGFVGMWHTHPIDLPVPSWRDLHGISRIVGGTSISVRRALLLIVGYTAYNEDKVVSASVYSRETFLGSQIDIVVDFAGTVEPGTDMGVSPTIGLALSGGGARAMAFHLGCLRALHDLGVLSSVRVISAVSGGSVLAALYAYSHDSFEDFDRQVCRVLSDGLQGRILRRWLRPDSLAMSLATAVGPGVAAAGANVAKILLRAMLGAKSQHEPGYRNLLRHIRSPWTRSWNRTNAFEAVLDARLFGGKTLSSRRRNDVDIVFNATELRTLSAFRFGSRESGCWRFGRLYDNDSVPLARAVAASAAYPLLLPSLDSWYEFERNSSRSKERVILADGGIYDNLGVSCLEPGRDERVSYNVFPVSYIISCDAGSGLPEGDRYPFWWRERMTASVESAFRQNQRATQSRLHAHVAEGRLQGFTYAYLGQRDSRLPYRPSDLVPARAVKDYPTDFAPMASSMIGALAGRGERLVRLLFDHYAPSL